MMMVTVVIVATVTMTTMTISKTIHSKSIIYRMYRMQLHGAFELKEKEKELLETTEATARAQAKAAQAAGLLDQAKARGCSIRAGGHGSSDGFR